mmetsp:Transcript_37538/g.55893  ORF Transcript_37538/g.55893 Transcript_37538/m.55893 type:complete len:86 (+) Transcript_37538:708-965(+)
MIYSSKHTTRPSSFELIMTKPTLLSPERPLGPYTPSSILVAVTYTTRCTITDHHPIITQPSYCSTLSRCYTSSPSLFLSSTHFKS